MKKNAGIFCLVLILFSATHVYSLSKEQVLIVYDNDNAVSRSIAEYYRTQRGIDSDQMLGLTNLTTYDFGERMVHSDYLVQVEQPVVNKVNQLDTAGKDIQSIVLMHGMPWKVNDQVAFNPSSSPTSRWASLDSELTVAGLTSGSTPLSGTPGQLLNPYSVFGFNGVNFTIKSTLPGSFDRSSYADMFLVTRIQGPTAQSARDLIDRAIEAEHNGVLAKEFVSVLDKNPAISDAVTNGAIELAHDFLVAEGFNAVLETTSNLYANPPSGAQEDTFFYWGWRDGFPQDYPGHDVYNFMPGSVGVHVTSESTYVLAGDWLRNLILDGVTATQFGIQEPFSLGFSDPFFFLLYYLNGYSFAEAITASNRFLSWQIVNIGDPLLTLNLIEPASVPEPLTLISFSFLTVLGWARYRLRKK
ncbi:TIGR03790 family protein [bacterium]|nr:TIGR03790 family protein [bacterium]